MSKLKKFLWRVGLISTRSLYNSHHEKAQANCAKYGDVLAYHYDERGRISGYHPSLATCSHPVEHEAPIHD